MYNILMLTITMIKLTHKKSLFTNKETFLEISVVLILHNIHLYILTIRLVTTLSPV